LEDLIATYGDSSATNWTDSRYQVWRHESGAAQGYVLSQGRAIAWGHPACVRDFEIVGIICGAFIDFCHNHLKVKPIWCCVNDLTEQVLSKKFHWRSVRCIAENVATNNGVNREADRKIRKAERDGTEIVHVTGLPEDSIRERLEEGLEVWQSSRSGFQVHTSELKPWRDASHRHYFYAKAKDDDQLAGLLVITEVEDGWYIKWNLEFPNAPGGTSELLANSALSWAKETGRSLISFGIGAADTLEAKSNLKSKFRLGFLAYVYSSIHKSFSLGNKTDFRRKFGIEETEAFVCWPSDASLGTKGLKAIMNVVKE